MFRFLSILSAICLVAASEVCAKEPANQADMSIPEYIEANRRNRDIVLNNPAYDKHAKVFYLFNISSMLYRGNTFEQYAGFLSDVHRKIFRKGAELIVHIEHSDTDEEMAANRGLNIQRQAKSCKLKCPILNSYKPATRNILYKSSSSSSYSYIPSSLIAVDAHGKRLATFYKNGDTVVMSESGSSTNSRTIVPGGAKSGTWEKDAILASYKSLVAKVAPQSAAATPAGEAEIGRDAHKQSDSPRKEPRKKRAPRWKKVELDY